MYDHELPLKQRLPTLATVYTLMSQATQQLPIYKNKTVNRQGTYVPTRLLCI